jgi:hypothetical protein
MLFTIQLDSQLLLRAIEVQYKILNRVLPSELITAQTPITQVLPEMAFYFCLVVP